MKFKMLLKNDFVKSVITLITGAGLSQVIMYASVLILTRIFSEEVFGVYMLFSSTVFILRPIFTMQYELAILLPKNDKNAINVFGLTLIVLFLLCSVLFFLIISFLGSFLSFYNLHSLKDFIYLLPVSIFILGIVVSLEYWSNRNKIFKLISLAGVLKTLTTGGTQIVIGVSSLKKFGLIPGLVLGQFVHFIILAKGNYFSLKNNLKHVSFKRMLLLAKRYKEIPLFNTLISFSNNLSNELPIFLLTRLFSLVEVGGYGLAIKIIKGPLGIIQQSVSQVFFNEASSLKNCNGDLNTLIKKVLRKMVLIAVLLFTLILISSYFLDYILGANWTEVGVYVRVLIPWLFMAMLVSPMSSLIVVLEKQKEFVWYDVIALFLRFIALFLGYYFWSNVVVSLLLFSLVGMLYNIFMLMYFYTITKRGLIS